MRIALFRRSGRIAWALATMVMLGAAACASDPPLPVAGSVGEEKFLYDRGMEALKSKRWLAAREYFRRLVDTHPRSPYRNSAKLGIGDSYLGEGRIDSLILAANEFREFLTLAPLSEQADYAQYRLALSQVRQMLGPQRDQTATRDALRELERFREAYPTSNYKPEVDVLYRQARDRLSDHEFEIGRFQYRNGIYLGALNRFRALYDADPGYTRRDALIFYLAETLTRITLTKEARPLYEELIKQYPKSEFVEEAKRRIGGAPAAPVTR